MNETVQQALTLIIPLVIAIVFHEVAHGWTARALGDPTASQLNRLSLNPLRHVDPVGTILVPGALALSGMPIFGWAKPVPVNKERLRNPKRDMMLVGAAGPASNLIMALFGAILFGLMGRFIGDEVASPVLNFIATNLRLFVYINVLLAIFNLLPIPPFDGSHIVEGLLPESASQTYAKLRPFGFPLLLVMLLVLPRISPQLDVIGRVVSPVVNWVGEYYAIIAAIVAGG